MTTSCTFRATYADDKPLGELSRLIAMRARVLFDQTTEQAVKATAINILTSLRAQTLVAPKNPSVIDERWHVRIEPGEYITGWAHPGKHARGRHVLRTGPGGHAINYTGARKSRVIVLSGTYKTCKNPDCYRLRIYSLPTPNKPWYDHYVIAANEEQVRNFAAIRIRVRIRRYRGISKRVLGLCAHKISAKQSPGSPCGEGEDLAQAAANVAFFGSGYNSGSFGVVVDDTLPFAVRALKEREASVNIAISNAAKRTRAIIEKYASTSLLEQIKMDFSPHNP